jgi:hypothetical protein
MMLKLTVLKGLALPLLFIGFVATSQTTIESADLPQEGDVFTLSQSAILDGFSGDDTGMNYDWDYSDLEAMSTDDISFVPVSETPFLYQFFFNNPFDPEYLADFGQAIEGINLADIIAFEDVYTYFQNTDTAYMQVGFAATINDLPVPSKNEPRDIIYNLPLNYMDEDSSYTEVFLEVPTFLTYKLKQNRQYTVDGWGNVETPFGSFNALRVKVDIEAVDSVVVPQFFIDFEIPRPLTTEYIWLAEGEGVPVLRIVETAGFVSQVEFKDEAIITSNVEAEAVSVSVFPNPTSDYLQIEGLNSLPTSIRLLNLNGSIAHTFQNIRAQQLDLPELAAGTYILQIAMKDGQEIRKKVSIR